MPTDLNNAQNWEIIYQEYKEAQQATVEGGYLPLSAFEVPVLINSQILIVKTVSIIPQGKRWKWAGNLKAFQQLSYSGLSAQSVEVANYPLYLNRSKLIAIPSNISNYQLTLSDAFWLRNLQLSIYQYTGIIEDDLLELATNTYAKVLTIETKIDDISSYSQ